jgi:GH43 family beta-xylosidase
MTLSDRAYTNPLGYADGVARTDPDPFVMRFRGRYYCYSTDEHQVNVSVSDDLVTWHRLGAALAVPDRSHFWAPCVYYHDGVFYLYVSNRPAGSDDPHEEVLQVAVSATPEGPFEVKRRFFDTFSIDPHVVPDGADGWVMFYSVNDVTGLDDAFTGTSIVADRMPTLLSLEGNPRTVVRPTLDEEIFERNRFGDGRDWYTIEGATYFARGGRAFLTYSGNAYEREDYFIGYATAPLDGAPHELAWTKHPDDFTWAPLVRRNALVEGTGHNSVVRGPNLVDDWIVYHGRNADQPLIPGLEQRDMRIDPVHHVAGRLVTDAPTRSPQDAPWAATVFDRLEGTTIAPDWSPFGDGGFAPGPDGVRSDAGRATLVHRHASEAFVGEVWVKPSRTDRGCRFGIVPAWTDEDNRTEALVDAASSTITVTTWRGGIGHVAASAKIPPLAVGVWHRLAFTRSGGTGTVAWDDLAPVEFSLPEGPGRVGFASVRTPAEFAAFTLTDHVHASGPDLARQRFTCAPDALASAEGLTAAGSAPVALAAPRALDCATAHTIELLGANARATIVPWESARSRVQVEISPERATASVLVDGASVEEVVIPREPTTFATVILTQLADAAVLRVDGWSRRIPIPSAAYPTQRVELSSARLTSYEQTDISTSADHQK